MIVRTMAKSFALWTIAMPGAAWCLGLGDITVDTVLNQPLRAEIKLLSVSPSELDDVRVSLASKETFERIGIHRPFVLSKLQFESRQASGGHASLEVTTSEPMCEPFLNFLVEVEWPRGRLLREYTVLLDPPLLMERCHAASVQAPAAVGALNESSGVQVAGEPVEYTVAPGDTLYGIAERHLPDATVSLSQVMLAILRANPDAFVQGNVNNLMTGAVLRIPTGDALVALNEQAAFAEVARQNELWHDDQSEPDAESASLVDDRTTGSTGFERTREQALGEAADTRDQPLAADAPGSMTVPIEESRLRIMASEAPGAETEAVGAEEDSGKDAVQTQVAVARELAESHRVEIAALTSKLEELKSIVTKQERVILLQAEALTELQQRLDGLDVADNGAIAPGVSQGSASERAVVAGEAASMTNAEHHEGSERAIRIDPNGQRLAPAQTVAPARSVGVIEAIFASPAMPGGFGAGAFLLLALIWLVVRQAASGRAEIIDLATYPGENFYALQRKTGTVFLDSRKHEILALDTSSQPADQHEIMRDKEPFAIPANVAPAQMAAKQGTDSVKGDTLAEADVYIAYGWQQQAEDLLKEVVKCNSKNIGCRLKLLELHYTTKNVQGFEAKAHARHQFLAGKPSGVWERVVAMGTELNTRNPPFVGPAAGYAAPTGVKAGATSHAHDPSKATHYSDKDGNEAGPLAGEEIPTNAPDDYVVEFAAPDLEATDIADVSTQVPANPLELSDAALDIDLFDLKIQDDLAVGQAPTPPARTSPDDSALTIDAEECLQFDPHADSGESDLLITRSEALDLSTDGFPGGTTGEILGIDGDLNTDESTGLWGEHEVGTKLDLARAYLDKGDTDGAMSILTEVLQEGDAEQRKAAEVLMRRIA